MVDEPGRLFAALIDGVVGLEKVKKPTVAVPVGTTWEDIEFDLADAEQFNVNFLGRSRIVIPHDLDMIKGPLNKPTLQWEMLEKFAYARGQPVGCIGILRPMLHKGTFIQAVGRGLRKVDPQRYPGIIKTDCVILDFAGAAIRHGCLEQEISLDDDDTDPGTAPYKTCPDCEAEIPLGTGECPFCGHVFTRQVGEKHILTDFELLEIDLLNQSPFQWCDVSGDGSSLIASGFDAWAGVFHDGTLWHALGGPKAGAPRKIAIGTKVQALAEADDFLRSAENGLAAAKSKRWLKEPASTKQLDCLRRAGASVSPMNFGVSKYDANCQLRYYWNRHAITSAVFGQAHRSAA
ncbi:zinc ribbon domain-containing protein [Novosphingobium arvoryzae]|uniref:zinc ribbon domain-containing protein n=1 Tax=Novosphingobium arvoryzae TaxID=1256514 RepID=UPI0016770F8B|nr:zinc ribbon domain-containing protein [Novosphingobium arvoryzae]